MNVKGNIDVFGRTNLIRATRKIVVAMADNMNRHQLYYQSNG